ncbi:hypothetical protein LDENG_00234610 [Lucifuga dentata]|nr:hypothetical protein LDENG_00234610 [Lucifuga dentata]
MVAAAAELHADAVRRYEEAELLVDSAMEFYSYDNKLKRKEQEYFDLSTAFLDNSYYKAYKYISVSAVEYFQPGDDNLSALAERLFNTASVCASS